MSSPDSVQNSGGRTSALIAIVQAADAKVKKNLQDITDSQGDTDIGDMFKMQLGMHDFQNVVDTISSSQSSIHTSFQQMIRKIGGG